MSCCCLHQFMPVPRETPDRDNREQGSAPQGPRRESRLVRLVRRIWERVMVPEDDGYAPNSGRLWHMLYRLGYDTEALGGPAYQSHMAVMAGRCRSCQRIDACETWLEQAELREDYRAFCVNAPLYSELPHRARHKVAVVGR